MYWLLLEQPGVFNRNALRYLSKTSIYNGFSIAMLNHQMVSYL